jgi:hypothetical protein
MKEKLDYIVKKLDLDMWKSLGYIHPSVDYDQSKIETEKTDIELIYDALQIILYDLQIIIEFNSKELLEQEPVLDKIINVLKTIENGTQSGI